MGQPGRSPSLPRDARPIAAAERRAKVVELRRQRLTFAEIGAAIGVSDTRAYQIYRRALALIPAPQVEEHRAEELGLVDDAIKNLLGIALDESVSPRTRIEAWTSARGWAEHKARLLGLNAPTSMQVITMDAIDAEIARLNAQLAGGAEGPETPATS